jgi:DNA-binding transcriptional LysR family regulator
MDDLPHLFEELMAFVAVVDAGGFNAAGDRFGVSPSRLSRSVAALEKHLGLSLLVRTSRRFAVTDIGRRTYADAVATRSRLQDAVDAARESQGEPSGFLRVSCPMVLASAVVGRIAIERHRHQRKIIRAHQKRFTASAPDSPGVSTDPAKQFPHPVHRLR